MNDIVRITGVSNAGVVANWRTRFADFPAERISGTQPRFDLVEVLDWLRDSGPRGRTMPEITPRRWWKWMLRSFHAHASAAAPRDSMAALVLLHHALHTGPRGAKGVQRWSSLVELVIGPQRDSVETADAGARIAERLLELAVYAEGSNDALQGLLVEQLTFDSVTVVFVGDLVDALDLALATDDHSAEEMLGYVLDTDPSRTRSQRSTIDRLARTMLAVGRARPGVTIFDPAAGEGGILLEAGRRLGSHVRLIGQELDESSWKVARTRAIVSGIQMELGPRVGDSLRDDQHTHLRADLVVIDPPVGDDAPPLARWIDHGLQHVDERGRVVIVLPMHEFVFVKSARRRPDKRLALILGELASTGRIEGVLMSPRGTRADLSTPVAIFTLVPSPARHGATRPSIPVVSVEPARDGRHLEYALHQIETGFAEDGFDGVGRIADAPVSVADVEPDALLDHLEHFADLFRGSSSRFSSDELLHGVEPSRRRPERVPSESPARQGAALDALLEKVEILSNENRRVMALFNEERTRQELFNIAVRHLLERLDALRTESGGTLDDLADDIERVRRDLR